MTKENFVVAIDLSTSVPNVKRFSAAEIAALHGNDWQIYADATELTEDRIGITTKSLVTIHNFLAERQVVKFSDRETAAHRTWAIINSKVELTTATKRTKNMELQTDTTNNIPDDVSAKMAESIKVEKAAAAEKAAAKQAKKDEAAAAAEKRKAESEAKKQAAATEKANKAAAKAAAKAEREAAKADSKANKNQAQGRKSALSNKLLKHSIGKDAEGDIKNPRRAGSHGFRSLQIIIDAGDFGIKTEDYVKAGGRMNDLHWDVDHGNVEVREVVEE